MVNRIYLIIFCFYSLCSYSQRNQLTNEELRASVLALAESHIGLQESTGNNDGAVCKFHKALGYNCGLPWCAMFGKYNLITNGVKTKMDARAVSIKNDPEAKPGQEVGGLYWYPTKYGTGHTGFVYSWDKKNSDKFVGLDGNYTDKVRFVQRSKSKHAQYISNPYPQSEDPTPVTIKKSEQRKRVPISEVPEQMSEEVALQIDSGNVTIDHRPYFIYRLKVIAVLCSMVLILSMIDARLKKGYQKITS